MQDLQGNEISMIFQEPMSSLNPVFTIGDQIAEVLSRHRGMDKAQALKTAVDLLDAVKIPDAANRIGQYPINFLAVNVSGYDCYCASV